MLLHSSMSGFVKPLTKILGILFVLVGAAGFFVNPLLFLRLNTTQSIVYVITGLTGLAASSNYSYARLFLIVAGLLYAAISVIGFVNGGDVIGFFDANSSENFVHLIVAIAGVGIGLSSKAKS